MDVGVNGGEQSPRYGIRFPLTGTHSQRTLSPGHNHEKLARRTLEIEFNYQFRVREGIMYQFRSSNASKQLTSCLAVAALLLIVGLPSVVGAFDGNRKGFVMGFGLGVTPVAHWTIKNTGVDETKQGGAMDFLAGYAWNNRNMLVYEACGSVFKTAHLSDPYVLQMLFALRWYHYWGAEKARFFTIVGAGKMDLSTEYTDIDGSGFGYCAGVGYELFKQVQISFNYQGGHTSNEHDIKANHHQLYFLAQVVAY
jgi:hypothetical protein